jgi:methylated-DNA-[protein]-cysteine S-methyltransferase
MTMDRTYAIKSPIGMLRAVFSDAGLRSLTLVKEDEPEDFSGLYDQDGGDRLAALKTFINDHFYGREPGKNDIPLDMEGLTPFRKRVYKELASVPYGKVVTYGELADLAGSPGGARAVGNAMNSNPFLILVPCHRVLASRGNGKCELGGFGAGLDTKRFLLRLEGHSDDIIHL